MNKSNKASIVEEVTAALDGGNSSEATNIAKRNYPWTAVEAPKRKMTQKRALSVFMKDGFIDRYSGSKLIFPGTLLVLGQRISLHINGAMTAIPVTQLSRGS